jgi:DNA replication protein DnaC
MFFCYYKEKTIEGLSEKMISNGKICFWKGEGYCEVSEKLLARKKLENARRELQSTLEIAALDLKVSIFVLKELEILIFTLDLAA